MIVNYNQKAIQVKIVFFGDELSEYNGDIKSILSAYKGEYSESGASVISCGNIVINGKEWNIKALLIKIGNKDFYATTRPALIEMTDGFIFMSNADKDADHRALNELFLCMGERLYYIPIAFMLESHRSDSYDIGNALEISNFSKSVISNSVMGAFNSVLKSLFPSIQIL